MANVQPSGSREERLQRVVARGERLRLLGRLRLAAAATATLALTGAIVGVTLVNGGDTAEMVGPLSQNPLLAPSTATAKAPPTRQSPEPSSGATGGMEIMAEGMAPLAKADGWRDDLRPNSSGFASRPSGSFLEIAHDREAAERAWSENVPSGLPPREGMPEDPGLYGELSDVDFEWQAVVVWSSGESGTCPGWLADVNTRKGRVEVEERIAQEVTWVGDYGCTDDRRTYRMVLAVPRDKLPSRGDLPIEQPSGLMVFHITEYPATESS